MAGTVYFINLRASMKETLFQKINRLMAAAGLDNVVKQRDLTAVKLHFGEMGNTAFIRPIYLREIVKRIKEAGGVPFLTDANTLYAGSRSDAVSHLTTAVKNGFSYSVVEAPVVIADGLRGGSHREVFIHQKRYEKVSIAAEIVNADALVSVVHFKGHDLGGFGGTLKNIGMGCASRRGKLEQHAGISPKVKRKRCIGCGACVDHCSQQAISLIEEKAKIDTDACIGCGECILVCPQGAVDVRWKRSVPDFMEKMVEHACGALKGKAGKALFLNFITNVTPACDCLPVSDAAIVGDIGIVAATDPVAIDQASVDLVNLEPGLAGTALEKNLKAGEDKFMGLYPDVDWSIQLDYAEKIGLGSRTYHLEPI